MANLSNIKIKNNSKDIATIIIDEPKTYNALSFKNLGDLIKAFKKLDNDKKLHSLRTFGHRGVGSTGWFIEPSTQTSSLKKIKSCNKIVENTYDFIERNHV